MKGNKVSAYLIGVYILLIGIQEPFRLPWFEGKIQLADLWFLVMAGYFITNRNSFLPILKNCLQDKKIRWFVLIGILYVFINGISVYNSYSSSGLSEWIGKVYLVIMSCLILLFLHSMDKTKIIDFVFQCFNFFGYSLTLVGIIGWIFSISGFLNETTQIYFDYPYFGDTHRLKALTTTPSMYISMISICIVLCLCNYLFYNKKKTQLINAVFFTAVAMLCFTKSFLFIVAAWIALYLFRYSRKPALIFLSSLCFVILHIVVTHFLLIPNERLNNLEFAKSPYHSNEIIYSSNDYSIVGSGYYIFKKTAWHLFKLNPILGIGPGNYNQQIASLKQEGLYPQHLPNYDPHSAYLGALAETGLIGFIALMALGLLILFFFYEMNVMRNPFSFALLILFCIIIAEGISMDTMNFRHYWIVVSIIVFHYLNTKNEISGNLNQTEGSSDRNK